MPNVTGNTSGLAPSALRAAERIFRRRVPADRISTPELVRSLTEASRLTKRQIGALVHRSGEVLEVVVGTATGLLLPDIGRLPSAEGRFRPVRLVHTHLYNEPLTADDLTDLTRLRLDLVYAILLQDGEPRSEMWAYNVPTDNPRDDAAYEVQGPHPYGREQPNFQELIHALEEEFLRRGGGRLKRAKDGYAILIHVGDKRRAGSMRRANSSLRELESLAQTAGVHVVDKIVQLRDQVDPKTLLGKGRLEQVVMTAIQLDAETLIFDCNLTPTQVSGIAQHTDLRVLDRTQLILDIFAQRAESRDGKLQVELAQLKYALPRLGQKDDALSRLTGGIGGRGPGETKLEIGRRRAKERVHRLEKELKGLARQRAERRRRRTRGELPVVAIVGYTNAGKSTLLNTLTDAGVLAEDKLFATLDTRARRLHLPSGRDIVLTDTVGFIRQMPKDLFSAFRATFEEAADAELLLELVDAADEERDEHIQTTEALLEELGLAQLPRLRVYNKADKLGTEERNALELDRDSVCVSALDKSSTAELLARIELKLMLAQEAAKAEEAEAARERALNADIDADTYDLSDEATPDESSSEQPLTDADDA